MSDCIAMHPSAEKGLKNLSLITANSFVSSAVSAVPPELGQLMHRFMQGAMIGGCIS